MDVTVVGAGYVGLCYRRDLRLSRPPGTCLDVDAERIEALHAGAYHLRAASGRLLAETAGRLRFTTQYDAAIPDADVIVIAVGTPAGPDGSPTSAISPPLLLQSAELGKASASW
jgi:UDPglucose 6-dehydrogenase